MGGEIQLDMEIIEADGNGGMQQPSSSDSGRTRAFRKRILEEVLNIDLRRVKSVVIQVDETSIIRRVEIQSSEENLTAIETRNDSPKEKALRLKFLGELPDIVRTGKGLKTKNEECLKLALVDSETGEIVDCAPESSAEVEIVVLEGKNNMTCESFERRIIKIGEKKKPHFVKRVYIDLKEGEGNLSDVKLGQDSVWTKKCQCRLGARIGQNLYAWTQPFKVIDNRDKDNKKRYPPLLSSEVWRLDEIGRDGKPCKRLKGKNIETLSDFLFWFHVDPEGLKQILLGVGGGDRKWKAIVAHATTCTTGDGRMHYEDDQRMFSHKSSNEPQMIVVYNFVGKLKGVINGSHFVPIDNLPADDKDAALKILRSVLEGSAFGERYNTPFDVGPSLSHRQSLEITVSTNSSLQPCSNGTGPTLSEHIYQATELVSSSQSINPSNTSDSGLSCYLVSKEIVDICSLPDLDDEKHETPPFQFDDVSRLVNIRKDGEIHKRLQDNKINTVGEFLIELLKDEEGIRKLVNLEREEWEAAVSSARACSTDNMKYCYTSLELQKGIVFNVLGDVLGLLISNSHFSPMSTLSVKDKGDAQVLLSSALKNWKDVEPFNETNHPLHLPLIASGGAPGGGSGGGFQFRWFDTEMGGVCWKRRPRLHYHVHEFSRSMNIKGRDFFGSVKIKTRDFLFGF